MAGLPEKAGSARYNAAVVVNPSGYLGRYRKVHLYYQEKRWFAAGDLGFPVFAAVDRAGMGYSLGVMVCSDWYFPESARSLALAGADVIAHPSNLVRKICPSAMPIRALENHLFTITANRTGQESNRDERLRFIGKSLICAPDGEVLASAGDAETHLAVIDLPVETARSKEVTRFNDVMGDRQPAAYRL